MSLAMLSQRRCLLAVLFLVVFFCSLMTVMLVSSDDVMDDIAKVGRHLKQVASSEERVGTSKSGAKINRLENFDAFPPVEIHQCVNSSVFLEKYK